MRKSDALSSYVREELIPQGNPWFNNYVVVSSTVVVVLLIAIMWKRTEFYMPNLSKSNWGADYSGKAVSKRQTTWSILPHVTGVHQFPKSKNNAYHHVTNGINGQKSVINIIAPKNDGLSFAQASGAKNTGTKTSANPTTIQCQLSSEQKTNHLEYLTSLVLIEPGLENCCKTLKMLI